MSSDSPRFIDDLVPLILESVEHWWPRDYARLAQVSSSWLFYVQKRLYSCPILYSLDSCLLLAHTLKNKPHLARLITSIELRPSYGPDDVGRGRVTGEHFDAIRVLLGLQDLQRLALGGLLSQRAERFLNTVTFPETVTELVVDADAVNYSCSPPTLELDKILLYRFPALKALKLKNLELDIVPSSIPLPTPINQLILSHVDIASGPGSLCQMTFGSSLDLLVIEADSGYDYDGEVGKVLSTCEVKELHYTVGQRCGPPLIGSFLRLDVSSNLQSLHLDGHIIDQGTLSDLARCYQGLEELVVNGRSIRVTAQEWISFMTTCSLPKLRKLGLPGGTNLPPFTKWRSEDIQALEAACSCLNIQLLTEIIRYI